MTQESTPDRAETGSDPRAAVAGDVVLVGPVAPGGLPSGRAIRRYTAAAANARSGASLGELLGDVYYAVIMTAIGVGMALGVAQTGNAALPSGPAVTAEPAFGLAGIVVVMLVGVAGAVLSLAGRLGPVGSAGAEVTWWLGLPVDRRGLLRPAARRLPVLAALVVGVVVGVLDAGLLAEQDMGRVLAVSVCAALAAATLVLAAGVAETAGVPPRWTTSVGDLVLAVAPVLAVVGVLRGWDPGSLGTAPVGLLVALLVVVVVLALVVDRRLGDIPSRALRLSGSVATQAAGAVVSLDSRELGRALTDSAAAPRRRRSRRFSAVRGPASALVAGDSAVLLRSVRHLVQVIVAALVPVLVAVVPQLTGRVGFVLAIFVGGAVAMTATAEGARRAEMVPALDRLLPLPTRTVRRLRMVVPGLVMLLWSVVAFAAIGWWAGDPLAWLALGIASTPVWAGAAVRSAYRPAPNWQGPLVSTPMGAIPGGVTAVLARGPDVVVLGLVPVLIAIVLGQASPALVLAQVVVSAIVFAVCSSTSTKSMMERLTDVQKAQQEAAGTAGHA